MMCDCTETQLLLPSFSCPAPPQSAHRAQGCVHQMTAQNLTFPHPTKSPACWAKFPHVRLPISDHRARFSACHQAFWPSQHFGKELKLQRREGEWQEMANFLQWQETANFPLSGERRQWSESSLLCKGGDQSCC